LHKVIQPGDVIWVHDYHLIPLAKMLRERGHKNKIGFFLTFRCRRRRSSRRCPITKQLFSTLTYYNLLGFQTEIDCTNFARYLTNEMKLASRDLRIFSAAKRTVVLGAFPVGVRTQEMNEWAEKGGALDRRAPGEREPGRPRHDHRCRPPRLQQGAGGAHGGVLSASSSPIPAGGRR